MTRQLRRADFAAAVAAVVAVFGLVAASAGPPSTGSAVGGPRPTNSPTRPAVGPGIGGTASPTAAPVPSLTLGEFDRDPCTVVSAEELRAALARPYDAIAANQLQQDGQPSIIAGDVAVGCGYRYVAGATDAAETFHAVTVSITRWKSGGADLLAACRAAATAAPERYRVVQLRDEACLGPGGVLPIRSGTLYFSLAATAVPGHANARDDELDFGTLALAAAVLLAGRLPTA